MIISPDFSDKKFIWLIRDQDLLKFPIILLDPFLPRIPKYSKSFTARIYHFLKVYIDINEMENLIKIEVDQLIQTDYFNVEIIKTIKESYHNEYQKLKSTSDVLLSIFIEKSKKENFFFFDCPFEVYINHYNPRKTKFLKFKSVSNSSFL